MGYFKRVALVKGHQKIEPPNHSYSSDLTELCYLGAFIQKDVELVTIPVSPYDRFLLHKFAKSLKRHRFDLVSISCMTCGYNGGREFARLARESGAYVVMGGYHPTALTDDVLSDPNVDAVVRGEGELTLRDLVLHGPGRAVAGLSFKEKGEIVRNPDRPLIQNLDVLPQPLRSIRPRRFGEPGDQYSIDTLYSSRGCIAHCTFCANDTVNKSFRPRSPEHFVEELEQIHDPHHKKVVKFWDSIFLFDPNRVGRIVELMFRRKLTNFRIVTESRSDDVIRCRDLMWDMKRVGFEKIQIGIESPDPETFRRLRKGGSIGKHEKAIRLVQEHGMKVEGFFIIGHPHETEADIKKYPEFAARLNINHRALYFVMTPYPGTRIYREFREKNLIDSYDWDQYNNFGTVVHLEKLTGSEVRNLLSYCYGRTWGIPYTIKKAKSVPQLVGLLSIFTIVWLYLFDLQGHRSDREMRNRFVAALYAAGHGSYKRKRKTDILTRSLGRLFKKVDFQIVVDDTTGLLVSFFLDRKEIRMDASLLKTADPNKPTLTLDDFDAVRSSIHINDFNAIMVLMHKKKYFFKGLFFCLPAVYGFGKALFRLLGKMGWRYLVSSRPVLM